jgi:MoxR-like ATPase
MNDASHDFGQAEVDLIKLEQQLNSVIIGQPTLIRELLVAIFAGGHVLLEGLPGLGKTHLAKAIAALLDLSAGRVQCTPDLLPADITGSEVLLGDASSSSDFEFRRGPVFANLVLVDEINRATPRTQAALLEAMQERQVTYGGEQHALPDPFWVIATQNPIELEGTFPLPEAQLDRFMVKLEVGYPAAESLGAVLDATLDREPADELNRQTNSKRYAASTASPRYVRPPGRSPWHRRSATPRSNSSLLHSLIPRSTFGMAQARGRCSPW